MSNQEGSSPEAAASSPETRRNTRSMSKTAPPIDNKSVKSRQTFRKDLENTNNGSKHSPVAPPTPLLTPESKRKSASVHNISTTNTSDSEQGSPPPGSPASLPNKLPNTGTANVLRKDLGFDHKTGTFRGVGEGYHRRGAAQPQTSWSSFIQLLQTSWSSFIHFVHPNSPVGFVTVIIVIATIAYLAHPGVTRPTCGETSGYDKAEEFTKRMRGVAAAFPGQADLMWRKVRAAVKENVRQWPSPQHPAVILLIYRGSGEGEQCVRRLLRSIGRAALNATCSHSTVNIIDVTDFPTGGSAMDTKSRLDASISAALSQEAPLTMLAVHHIERLSPEASLLLHNYCDDQHAPHKRSLILLTASLDTVTGDTDDKAVERAMADALVAAWSKPPHIGLDQIKPILARIAGYSSFLHTQGVECGAEQT